MDTTSIGEIDDVSKSTTAYIRKKYPVVSILVAVLFAISLFGFVAGIIDQDINFIALPAIVFVIGCGGFYFSVRGKIQSSFMQQLATAIGFKYEAAGDFSSIKANFAKIGHTQKMSDVLSGTYKNSPVRIFNYSFIVGYGRSARSYRGTSFELQAKGHLPDIVVQPKSFVPLGDFVNDWRPKDAKSLILEGDFNKYFSVFTPDGSEVEALQILSPNIMADLIDNYKNLTFEFTCNTMYIVSMDVIQNRKSFLAMLSLTDRLYDILLPTLEEMAE